MPGRGRICLCAFLPVIALGLVRAAAGSWTTALVSAGAVAAAGVVWLPTSLPHQRARRWLGQYFYWFGFGIVFVEFDSSSDSDRYILLWAIVYSLFIVTSFVVMDLVSDWRKRPRPTA